MRRMPPEGIWRTAPVMKEMELFCPDMVAVPAGRLRVRWLRMWPVPVRSNVAPAVNTAFGEAVPERVPPDQVKAAAVVILPEPVSVALLRVVAPLSSKAPLVVRVPPMRLVAASWPPLVRVREPELRLKVLKAVRLLTVTVAPVLNVTVMPENAAGMQASSVAPGTPEGVQLPAVLKSPPAALFHCLVEAQSEAALAT